MQGSVVIESGNLTHQIVDGQAALLEYDAENRPVRVYPAAGLGNPGVVDYRYDGDGQRVQETGYVNLAAGRPATGTSALVWPLQVTDGDLWADSGNSSSGEYAYTATLGQQAVVVDLGAVHSVGQVRLWHYAGDGRTYHNTKTEVSADGQTWETIYDSASRASTRRRPKARRCLSPPGRCAMCATG